MNIDKQLKLNGIINVFVFCVCKYRQYNNIQNGVLDNRGNNGYLVQGYNRERYSICLKPIGEDGQLFATPIYSLNLVVESS